MTQLDPEAAAADHIHIHRCLGNLASGNDYKCHPNHEPGGYDVGFAMMHLNVQEPFATFKEAQEFAVLFQHMVGIVLKKDRNGEHVVGLRKQEILESLREVDVFGGRDTYVLAENYFKTIDGKYAVIGDVRKCRFGWLARWDTRAAWKRWGGKRGWYAWNGESKPDGLSPPLLLIVPPKGDVYRLAFGKTLDERLQKFSEEHPEVLSCYEITSDYNTLVDAGIADWRAEAVLGLSYTAQIEVAWSAVMHKDLDPRFAKEARAIIERCAVEAGVTLEGKP